MQKRIILLIDMDAFFAQIEERENPQFQGKPIVVGSDPKQGRGRGVVSTANYIARKYGIKSAMPISEAWRRCPTAIFLPVNFQHYENISCEIMEIIKKYSPCFEQVSLDEAYLELADSFTLKTAENLAKKLKKEIFEKENLTSTVGIGHNKLIAKIAAEKAKPDGLLVITQEKAEKFLEPFDIKDMPGIGEKTAEKLRAIGINTIKEIKNISKEKLKGMFGSAGELIYEKARGIDERAVVSDIVVKSIGKENTFENDTRDPEAIFNSFEEIIDDISHQIRESGLFFKNITVVCRFSGFETHTKSKTLKAKSNDKKILAKESKNLLLRFLVENLKPIRMVGVRIKIV